MKLTRFDRILYIYALVIAAVLPTQWSIGIWPGAEKPIAHLCLADILIWIGLAAVAVRAAMTRFKGFRSPPLVGMLIVVWAFIAAAVIIGRGTFAKGQMLRLDHGLALKELIQFAGYFLAVFVVIRNAVKERSQIWVAAFVFVVAGMVALVMGLDDYMSKTTPEAPAEGQEVSAPVYEVPVAEVSGPFTSRNGLGALVALMVPLAVGIALFGRGITIKIAAAVVVVAAAWVTLSGGAFIAAVAGVLAVCAARSPFALGVGAIASAIVLCLVGLLPRDNAEEMLESVRFFPAHVKVERPRRGRRPAGVPISPRYAKWQAAMELVKERSVIGVGIGNYQRNIGSYYGSIPKKNENLHEKDTDNTYLVVASELGVPGLALLACLLFWAAATSLRTLAGLEDPLLRGVTAGVFGSMVAMIVCAPFCQILIRGVGTSAMFLAALGAAAGDTIAEPEEQED